MYRTSFNASASIANWLALLYQSKGRCCLLLLMLLPLCFLYFNRSADAALLDPASGLEVAQNASPIRTTSATGAVYISEFMASNSNTLADEEGDFSDWIEIYNSDSAEVDLAGWYLTDDTNDLTKWQFPATTLAADAYLVVFASDKDRDVASGELHTNFKLKSGGEYLALVQPDGTTIAAQYSPQYPPQFRDVSYGLDGSLNERYFTQPTPGSPNGSGQADLGPIISAASHTPALPSDSDDLSVTVTVAQSLSPVSNVTLHYRVMFSETFTTTMFDDGAHGDGAADDGVYGAMIPASASIAGQMVRYYISADDSDKRTSRWPLFQEPTASPEYFGTVIADASVSSQLPILQWFLQDTAAAETRDGTRASLFYDGVFYDNVFVRRRGGFSSSFPKKSFKFEFNRGAYFKFSPDEEAVDEFNLNTTYSDQAYIRPALAFETYRDTGSFYSITFPMRIHRNGAFYSVALFVEQPDDFYLERQGLDPDGALYKMLWNPIDSATTNVEKKTRKHEDRSDLQALVDGIHLTDTQRTMYLFDHVNLPAVINYLASALLIEDWDIVMRNYYLYRDSDGTGEWMVFPWDKDLTFGNTISPNDQVYGHPLYGNSDYPATYAEKQYWNHLTDAMYDTPVIQEMYLRRLRSLMDQYLKPLGTPTSQLYYEPRLDQFLAQMESDAEEDRAIWGSFFGNWQSFESAIGKIKNSYLPQRRIHLYNTHGPSGSGLIPSKQSSHVTVNFGPYEINPISGNPDEEFLTLLNPNNVAVDLSGWQLRNEVADQIEYTFQPGVVIPAGGTLYVSPQRDRVPPTRHLSHRRRRSFCTRSLQGSPIQLTPHPETL